MQKAVCKTEAELRAQATFTPIKCRDYGKYEKDSYWHCWRCKTLFSPDDEVLLKEYKEDKRLVCPTVKTFLFIKWRCRYSLSSASKEYFEREYHLTDMPK